MHASGNRSAQPVNDLMNRSLSVIVWSAFALAALLLIGEMSGVCFYERGGEFSPDTFRVRSYQAYRCGPVQFPKWTEERGTPVSDYLAANGYVDSPQQVRWRLIGGRGGSAFTACTFSGDCKMIRMRLEGEQADRLLAWSEENPDLAKVFWTKVVEWVREERHGEAVAALWLIDQVKRDTVEDVRKILVDAVYAA